MKELSREKTERERREEGYSKQRMKELGREKNWSREESKVKWRKRLPRENIKKSS